MTTYNTISDIRPDPSREINYLNALIVVTWILVAAAYVASLRAV